MQVLDSWKDSLQFLKWANVKQFLSDFIQALSQVYPGWFKYGCWALLPATALIWFLPSFEYIEYASLWMILGLSISLAYSFTVLFIIVQEVIHQQSISLATYKKHLVFLFVVMAILFAAALYWLYHPVIELFSDIAAISQKMLQKMSATQKTLWEQKQLDKGVSPESNAFEIRKVITYLLIIIYEPIVKILSFIVFFFLHDTASIRAFGKSTFNTLKFIFYNLPLLITIHLILVLLIGLPFTALMNFIEPVIVFLINTIFILPIIITLHGQLYKERRQANPTLYT